MAVVYNIEILVRSILVFNDAEIMSTLDKQKFKHIKPNTSFYYLSKPCIPLNILRVSQYPKTDKTEIAKNTVYILKFLFTKARIDKTNVRIVF